MNIPNLDKPVTHYDTYAYPSSVWLFLLLLFCAMPFFYPVLSTYFSKDGIFIIMGACFPSEFCVWNCIWMLIHIIWAVLLRKRVD